MPQIPWDYLWTNYPQVATCIFIILAIIFAVYFITKFMERTNRVCKNEFPVFKKTLERIDKSLITLNTILIERKQLERNFYESGSAIKINELGYELLKTSFAQKLLDENINSWIIELEKIGFTSPLEVEKGSYTLMLNKMDSPEFEKIQTFTYNNKSFKEMPLVYSDILFVMGLYLRDKYLEKHTEIKQS